MKMIDVHCHIDQYDLYELEDIFSKKDIHVIGAAMHKASGEKLLKMKKSYKNLSICFGIHPEYPDYYDEFEEVKKQIIENKDEIIAIGEIGMPYYSLEGLEENEKQEYIEKGKSLLIQFLDLAKELDLPVVLHSIETTAKIALEELKRRKIKKALFHWFEGDLELMKEITREGYYISVSPDVMYNKSYRAFVKNIPIENLVLESDGPWAYNGEKGVPEMIIDSLAYISKEKNIEEIELRKIFYENAEHLFGDL